MALTQADLARQMLAQMKVLDPTVSAEIGTPERKIIDTVAQALAENQIDLDILSGSLDLDSKFGANLDRFLALFGFERQRSTKARGFVTFSREAEALTDIRVPTGTQVVAHTDAGDIFFVTTADVTLLAGELSVIAPIEAVSPGASGNVGAQTIADFTGGVTFGVTTVTNETAITGGQDQEPDDEFKIRFKNTVFRNLAGTESQYLALAASSAYTTKANVVGSISRYREYLEVPQFDDATPYDINEGGTDEPGNGMAGRFSTALSTIPYSKHVYTEVPHFISSGPGATATYYRDEVDYILNTDSSAKNQGDAYRLYNPQEYLSDPPNLALWRESVPDPEHSPFQPNVTFLNVYQGPDAAINAIRPQDVVLFEHSYLSSSSRNDWDHNVTNCVDVFIDGGNIQFASTSVPVPQDNPANTFTITPSDRFYVYNYRRQGEPLLPPVMGNFFIPLYWQPATEAPSSIVIDGTVSGVHTTATYFEGSHYWLVEDVSDQYGTIRARNGIEWSGSIKGMTTGVPEDPTSWVGPTINEWDAYNLTTHTSNAIPIQNYAYDRNIVDIQAAFEGSRQVTTDALVHRVRWRYFKLDVSVMYTQGASITDTNLAMREALATFFSRQYFGTAIQLSDLLQTLHNVGGVDNVRWSSDIPTSKDLDRVIETDNLGNPLVNVYFDPISPTQQRIFVAGEPTDGTFTVEYLGDTEDTTVAAFLDPATSHLNLRTILSDVTGVSASSITITGTGTLTDPFLATFGSPLSSPGSLIASNVKLTGGGTVYQTDFFLADDELPALPDGQLDSDTLPGLIIRKRAQNTWTKSKAVLG